MPGEAQHLTRVDPMRILDLVGIEPIDRGPEVRIAKVGAGEVPQRVAALDGVRRRDIGTNILRATGNGCGKAEKGGGGNRPAETRNVHALEGCGARLGRMERSDFDRRLRRD